ncbi:MAG: CPBP family intramembrane metalloprotease [Clostridia bacterium]|nr:CPBP family intramembrane metalloprotease [Clostridia bacterium]
MRKRHQQPEPESARPTKQLAALLEGLEQEETPRAGHMKAVYSGQAAGAIFAIAALDLSAFLLGITVLGRSFGMETSFEIGAQLFVGVLTLLLIKYMDSSYQIGLTLKGFKVSLLALFPLALATVAWMRPFPGEIWAQLPLIAALSALTEAVWEEACFRGLGAFLFAREDGRISSFALVGTSLVFGALKLIRLVAEPDAWAEIVLCAVFSAALGVFLMALYVYTKNLTVPIVVHFLFNLAERVPRWCSAEPRILGQEGSVLLLVTDGIVLIVLAVWLFLRNKKAPGGAPAADTPSPAE